MNRMRDDIEALVGARPCCRWPSAACAKKKPPVARPLPPPPTSAARADAAADAATPRPNRWLSRSRCRPCRSEDAIGSKSLDDLNRDSPLTPVFFDLDSSSSTPRRERCWTPTPRVLKKIPTWQITIEGHCDERGTAEYNLALGERRAVAAQGLPGVARHRRPTRSGR